MFTKEVILKCKEGIMPIENGKPAGEQGTGQSPQEKAIADFIAAHTDAEGNFDAKGAAEAYGLRDTMLHQTRQEAKERRLREEQLKKELDERESKVKAAEEAKLLEEKRYQELIEAKNKEITELSTYKTKAIELEKFHSDVIASQKAEIDKRVAALGKDQRDIFEVAAGAMPEDAVQAKLDLLSRLSTTANVSTSRVSISAVGGRESGSNDDSVEALMELKSKNPELYYQKIREQVINKK
jgi:vacuolar-type H+-ATPase subunit I/STV1